MTEKLKAMIDNAIEYDYATCKDNSYACVYIVPTGEKYNGFWGENGYDSMIILAEEVETRKIYKISDYADVFTHFRPNNATVDIPSELGCIRMRFGGEIVIEPPASSVLCHRKE